MSASQNKFLPNLYVCELSTYRAKMEGKERRKIPDCCIMEMILSHEIFRSCKKYFRIRKRRERHKRQKLWHFLHGDVVFVTEVEHV